MLSAGEFRNGVTLEIDNAVYQVVEFQHVKPGKGAAFVRTKALLKEPSVLLRNSLRHTSKDWICSISMKTEICITS